MKIQPLLLFILFFNFQFLFSQDLGLSVLTIPDSLKQNANSVVRFYNTNIELVSHRKMIIKVKKAITILNKLGDDESEITVYYDNNRKIKSLKAVAYNSFGNQIKKISKKDFKDYSAADGFSLFNDNRLKHYNYIPISYPYTIYYEYEIESPNTAHIPKWYPIGSYNQSVQQSTYHLAFPNNLTIKKIKKRFDQFAIKSKEENNSLSFEIDNSVAIKYEESCPSFINIMPWLMVASNKFHLEGEDGSANNWKEFGKWRYDNLYNGKDKINESTKEYVNKLVENINNPIEKAKIIYEFVQNKTRYISVQEGIGGWKPIKANEVDRLGYGDCKGLTNYTKTLLDAVGVKSHYSVIWAGKSIKNVEENLFSMQGNHVILNLPTDNGDIWLECTSQTVPFGYQGTFTDDRDVLVIKPEGGEIKHTGIHNDKDSFQKTKATYTINSDGSIKGEVTIHSAGIQYKDHYNLEKKSKREINEYYKDEYWSHINNLNITNYSFTNDRDNIIFKEKVVLNATDYATFSGDRMLFTINVFNKNTFIPKRYRNRKLPLEISRGFIDKDQFEITLPGDYTIEAIPDDVLIENKFGKYQISIKKINENKLQYSRTLFIKKGLYPKSEYKNYRNFRKKTAKLDKTKIVLIKK
jgi:hypothetical protein